MEITPATPEQIDRFKVGAATRYRELGIPPKLANALFDIHLAGLARQLGMEASKDKDK